MTIPQSDQSNVTTDWQANSKLPASLYMIWLISLLVCAWVDFIYLSATAHFPDEQRFLESAAHWLSTGSFNSNGGSAWEMPLPSMLFSVAHYLAGGTEGTTIHLIRLFQSLLLITQSWLVWRITLSVSKRQHAAMLAAAVTALYPFLVYYQALVLSEILFITLLLATILALYVWRERGCHMDVTLVFVMLLAGLTTYAKASLTFLVPLMLPLIALVEGRDKKRVLAVFAAGLALYCVVLSPWWVRNYAQLGEFVPFTTSSAANLYLGNNSANRSGGNDWASDVEKDVVAQINALPGELQQQAAYSKHAREFIACHPARSLQLTYLKFKRFWNIRPNAEGYNSGWHATIAMVTFGPVLILSMLGVIWNRKHWRALLPIYLLIAYLTLLHSATIASLRYRLPLEPFLIILAALSAIALADKWSKRPS